MRSCQAPPFWKFGWRLNPPPPHLPLPPVERGRCTLWETLAQVFPSEFCVFFAYFLQTILWLSKEELEKQRHTQNPVKHFRQSVLQIVDGWIYLWNASPSLMKMGDSSYKNYKTVIYLITLNVHGLVWVGNKTCMISVISNQKV